MDIRKCVMALALMAMPYSSSPQWTSINPLGDWIKENATQQAKTAEGVMYDLPFSAPALGPASRFLYEDVPGAADKYAVVLHRIGAPHSLTLLFDANGDGYPDAKSIGEGGTVEEAQERMMRSDAQPPRPEDMALYNSAWDQLRIEAGLIRADNREFLIKQALLQQEPNVNYGARGIIYSAPVAMPGYDATISFESRRWEHEWPRAVIHAEEHGEGITVHLWRDDHADGSIDAAFSGTGKTLEEAMTQLNRNVVYRNTDATAKAQAAYDDWFKAGTPVPE